MAIAPIIAAGSSCGPPIEVVPCHAEYVGLGPKWVIRRYRLHEVGERLASGVDLDWVRLAGELGYADQAHFIRDFTAMIGETPTRYAERYPGR